MFGELSVGARLKGWAGPQGGGEPPAQHIGHCLGVTLLSHMWEGCVAAVNLRYQQLSDT